LAGNQVSSLSRTGGSTGPGNWAILCPERYDEEELRKIKETMGTMMFSALYQQNPALRRKYFPP